LLTRDNLEKRHHLDDNKCLFCDEKESVDHLFFRCVVAGQASSVVLEIIGFSIVNNFESMARCWLCNKKYGIVNVISSAVRSGI
jgi:hypothetical protein